MSRVVFALVLFAFAGQAFAETVFPQIALGAGYESVLIVSNESEEETCVITASLRQENGLRWQGGWSINGRDMSGADDFEISLPPLGTSHIVITGDDRLEIGYLTLLKNGLSSPNLTVSFFYNLLKDGELIDSVSSMPGSLNYRFLVPVERRAGINTGFAWAPYEVDEPFVVTLRLFDSDGSEVAQVERLFEGHLARFFTEIFTEVPDEFVGSLHFNAPEVFYLTALRLDTRGFTAQLTGVPPRGIAFDSGLNLIVDPDALHISQELLTYWEIKGKVTSRLSSDAYFVQVVVRALNSKGQLLDSGDAFIAGTTRELLGSGVITGACLLEGESGYFEVPVFNVDEEPASFDVTTFAWVSETAEPSGRLAVSEYTVTSNDAGRTRIVGTLTNEGDEPVEPGFVRAALLDRKGKVLDLAIDQLPDAAVAPGETIDFDIQSVTPVELVEQVVVIPDWDAVDTAESISAGAVLNGRKPAFEQKQQGVLTIPENADFGERVNSMPLKIRWSPERRETAVPASRTPSNALR